MDNSIKLMAAAKDSSKHQMIKNPDGTWTAVNTTSLEQTPLGQVGVNGEPVLTDKSAGFGAPQIPAAFNSTAGMTPTKRDSLKIQLDKQMAKDNEHINSLRSNDKKMQDFMALNEKQSTGGITGFFDNTPLIGRMIDSFNPNLEEINKRVGNRCWCSSSGNAASCAW